MCWDLSARLLAHTQCPVESNVSSCLIGRWFWWRLLDDLAGVNARAAHVRGRRANPLHPRGSGFGPPDGHGDRSLWVTHGQRQPAHLAIGEPPLRYGETSSRCHPTETSGEMFLVFLLQKWYRRAFLRGGAAVVWRIPNKYSLFEEQIPKSHRCW